MYWSSLSAGGLTAGRLVQLRIVGEEPCVLSLGLETGCPEEGLGTHLFVHNMQSQLVFQRAAVVMGNRSLFFLNYLILGILSELNDFFISLFLLFNKPKSNSYRKHSFNVQLW